MSSIEETLGLRRDGPIITVLDIGSSEMRCFIVELDADASGAHGYGCNAPVRLLGAGCAPSRGITGGNIIKLSDAEECVRRVVDLAERNAGHQVPVHGVVLPVANGQLECKVLRSPVKVGGVRVTPAHIRQGVDRLARETALAGRTIIHLNIVGYGLANGAFVQDALGLVTDDLEIEIHVVTMEPSAIANLDLLLDRCYLKRERLVPTGLAAAASALNGAEAEHGAVVLDLGAGTASLGIVSQSRLVATESWQLGSSHINSDICRLLATSLEEAERIKTLSTTVSPTRGDGLVEVPYSIAGQAGHVEVYHTTRERLAKIAAPRIDDLLGHVTKKLARVVGKEGGVSQLVLTGGASQLMGLGERAQNALGLPVRVAAPTAVANMDSALAQPQYASVHGAIHACLLPTGLEVLQADRTPLRPALSTFARLRSWFIESFWDDELDVVPRGQRQ